MNVNERTRGRIAIIHPKGRLTAETASSFTATIGRQIESGFADLIVDLGEISYIDSAGLGAIVQGYTSAQRRGGRMVLVHVAGKNKDLLTITKLLTVFDVYDSELEAERTFGRASETVVA